MISMETLTTLYEEITWRPHVGKVNRNEFSKYIFENEITDIRNLSLLQFTQ